VSGFGNVLGQAWIVHDLDQRWAVALGGQLIAPTATNGVATDAWEQVTGVVVRAMLPEISPGSYFAPQCVTESISKAMTMVNCCGNCASRRLSTSICRTILYALPEPRHSAELWDASVESNGPIVSAGQLYAGVEADRAYRDLGRVRHSDHQGFSRLHVQDSIESGLFVLIAVLSTFSALAANDRPRAARHFEHATFGLSTFVRYSRQKDCGDCDI
jgi:hypothetical protein